jgi:AraC-like DNA-binding protein
MPSSAILNVSDPYEYQAALSDSEDLKCIITAPGDYHADLTLIDLHQLQLQRGSVSLPRIVYSAHTNDLCNFCFSTADQPPVLFNGIEVPQVSMAFYSPRAEYFVRSSGECFWGGISLAQEALAAAAQSLIGREITAPISTQLISPSPPLMARLLTLHRAASQLAVTASDILVHPEVSRAIEQELSRAMIACLASSRLMEDRNSNRQAIMRRLQQVLEANENEPLYIPEICAAIGVTDRTLRNVCSEYLGMGPHRYLWLRRMHLARRAFTLADASAKTVTEIANDHGFGELGRFAVSYRRLFGESPSATLRRPPTYSPGKERLLFPKLHS